MNCLRRRLKASALPIMSARPKLAQRAFTIRSGRAGKALDWSLVDGVDAKASGLIPNAESGNEFIRVDLARPVPEDGRGRMLIDKTYKDAASYFTDEDGLLVFDRTLGVKRNAVVLPAGYELVSVSYPSQMLKREDGRLEISFINPGSLGVPYRVVARPVVAAPGAEIRAGESQTYSTTRPIARTDYAIQQRASQTRDISYFLQQPETHDFRLYHDYEEMRVGMDRYLNVVRPGSKASKPSAKILDTGEVLKVETLRGAEISARGIDIGDAVSPATELVAIWFDAVEEGQSKLLRIEETYTDASRYFPTGPNTFLWDRSFGRSRNTVVLPEGWFLTELDVPAAVSMDEAGRTVLTFSNDRPGVIDVLIRGQRRAG